MRERPLTCENLAATATATATATAAGRRPGAPLALQPAPVRWASVAPSHRGPGGLCALCGRERSREALSASHSFGEGEGWDDAVFRSVHIDGARTATTVCGRCLRDHAPLPTAVALLRQRRRQGGL